MLGHVSMLVGEAGGRLMGRVWGGGAAQGQNIMLSCNILDYSGKLFLRISTWGALNETTPQLLCGPQPKTTEMEMG